MKKQIILKTRKRDLFLRSNEEIAQSEYEIGLAYELGEIVEKDLELACYYMYLAYKRGHIDAKNWLENYFFDDDANIQALS